MRRKLSGPDSIDSRAPNFSDANGTRDSRETFVMAKLPMKNELAHEHRKAIAERCLGKQRECACCAESRVFALDRNTNPRLCFKCKRAHEGKNTMDNHHVPGKANSDMTVRMPVNEHAELSEAQRDWPEDTLRNPEGCPLRAGAAGIRGTADLIVQSIKAFLLWIAEMLELLSDYLAEKLGPNWWINTQFEKYAPKRKNKNVKS